jgi:hypothetical protein
MVVDPVLIQFHDIVYERKRERPSGRIIAARTGPAAGCIGRETLAQVRTASPARAVRWSETRDDCWVRTKECAMRAGDGCTSTTTTPFLGPGSYDEE